MDIDTNLENGKNEFEIFSTSEIKFIMLFYSRESRNFKLIRIKEKGSHFEYDGFKYRLTSPKMFWSGNPVHCFVKNEHVEIDLEFLSKENRIVISELEQQPDMINDYVESSYFHYAYKPKRSKKAWFQITFMTTLIIGICLLVEYIILKAMWNV